MILAATSVPLPGGGVLDRPLVLFGLVEADKVGHAALYAVLGWLTVGALDAAEVSAAPRLLAGVAAAAAFAALDEWHQSWIPSRTPEMVDWVADTAGLVVGAVARTVRERTRSGGEGAPGPPRRSREDEDREGRQSENTEERKRGRDVE